MARFIVLFLVGAGLIFAVSPERKILNRKNISHLAVNTWRDGYQLVLLVSNRFPYNYKSSSYPLYYRVRNEKQALAMMEKLDKYLETGKNLTVLLAGSRILKIRFTE